jgi:hypothetical protein
MLDCAPPLYATNNNSQELIEPKQVPTQGYQYERLIEGLP